jgi:beta-lactamase class A
MRRRKGANVEHILLIILLGMVALAVFRYVTHRQQVPRPVQIGDLVLSSEDEQALHQRLKEEFSRPLILRCLDEEVKLDPQDIGFRVYIEETLDQLRDQPPIEQVAADFLAVTLGGSDRPLPLPVLADYDAQALWHELQSIAVEWDRPAQPPRLIKAKLQFVSGEPARRLDLEASLPDVVTALLSPSGRQVDMSVVEGDGDPFQPTMDLLQGAIEELLSGFSGVAGVFVRNLDSGEEMAHNGEVAFSGMSLLKIAIMEEFYRQTDSTPTLEESNLLSQTMTARGNYAANLLLARIGEDDAHLGAQRLTESMRRVGLANTFMAGPYDSGSGGPPPQVETPANSRRDVNTDPDPYVQTTPQDTGLLVEMIYEGTAGGGTLLAAYPGEITAAECLEMLDLMKSNRIGTLIEEGLPENMSIAHKHGWIDDTHADAGIVFSPASHYVLAIFVHQQGWLEFEQSGPLIADIAHVVYNYFNMEDQW